MTNIQSIYNSIAFYLDNNQNLVDGNWYEFSIKVRRDEKQSYSFYGSSILPIESKESE